MSTYQLVNGERILVERTEEATHPAAIEPPAVADTKRKRKPEPVLPEPTAPASGDTAAAV